MNTITIADIWHWNPCYDPTRYLPENWEGTALDILTNAYIPPKDKVWVVCRDRFMDLQTLKKFAISSARTVQHLMKDERSLRALDIAERYIKGEVTDADIQTAYMDAKAAFKAAKDARAAAVNIMYDAGVAAAGVTVTAAGVAVDVIYVTTRDFTDKATAALNTATNATVDVVESAIYVDADVEVVILEQLTYLLKGE